MNFAFQQKPFFWTDVGVVESAANETIKEEHISCDIYESSAEWNPNSPALYARGNSSAKATGSRTPAQCMAYSCKFFWINRTKLSQKRTSLATFTTRVRNGTPITNEKIRSHGICGGSSAGAEGNPSLSAPSAGRNTPKNNPWTSMSEPFMGSPAEPYFSFELIQSSFVWLKLIVVAFRVPWFRSGVHWNDLILFIQDAGGAEGANNGATNKSSIYGSTCATSVEWSPNLSAPSVRRNSPKKSAGGFTPEEPMGSFYKLLHPWNKMLVVSLQFVICPPPRIAIGRCSFELFLPTETHFMDGLWWCGRCRTRHYQRRGDLMRHLRLECGVEPQFVCPVCAKKFTHKGNWKMHVRSVHGVFV